MVRIKTKKDIEVLRAGGRLLAFILRELAKAVKPGVATKALDQLAFVLAKKSGGFPAFLNYKPEGAKHPYPASLCVSINDEVVHGIPSEEKILKEGDIVSLDMGLKYKNLFTDAAITVPVGKIDPRGARLIKVTEKALKLAIEEIKPGKTTGDIGFVIENFVKKQGFTVNKVLAGHGVGYKIHEDPYLPNFGNPGEGEKLKPGMVIAIEPMVNEGKGGVYLAADNWTFKTRDGKRSAHFEHTVVVTENGAEVLTGF